MGSEKTEKNEQFNKLTPEFLVRSIQKMGFVPTGRIVPLNSYENRVFEIELEHREPIVIKVYRPGRWSLDTISDEHRFIEELIADGVDTVAPLKFRNEETILESGGLFFAAFDKIKGRLVDEFIPGDFEEIGRLLARLHNVGARKPAQNRKFLSANEAEDALNLLQNWIRPEVIHRYEEASHTIIDKLAADLHPEDYIRIHGDCHRGNLMDDGEKFFFVDFDDFCNGPMAQDFWMLLSSDQANEELDELLEGYSSLREPPQVLEELFDPLRGFRVITYSAWIARRWSDPTFPKLFPQFRDPNYWAAETEALEKIAWRL